MSPDTKDTVAKHAARMLKNPTAATTDDVRKLARAVLLLTTGKVP